MFNVAETTGKFLGVFRRRTFEMCLANCIVLVLSCFGIGSFGFPIIYEGRPCEDSPGICTAVKYCPTALNSLKLYGRHNLERCGFQGFDEIVCCPDDTSQLLNNNSSRENPVTPTSKTPSSMQYNLEPNNRAPAGRKAEQACNELLNEIPTPVGPFIFGGESAQAGEFPHMAALGYLVDEEIDFQCGGSLIHKRYILTAAHCVIRADGLKPTMVRLGKVDIIRNTDNLVAQDYKVDDILVHPEYNRQLKLNDIALIRLKKNVKNTDYVHPACLYTKDDDPDPVIITGWGLTSHSGSKADILQKVTLNSVPTHQCNNTLFTRFKRKITANQICAASDNGIKDACQGDSGGPMQIEYSSQNSIYTVVGVVSYGVSCGGKLPAVYTRVNKYLDWIEPRIWP